MDEAQVQRIMNDPDFKGMARKKTGLGMTFTVMVLVVWFGYLLLVGFDREMFAAPISAGSTTPIGFYIVMAIMIFVPAITWIYVSKANGEFDTVTRQVIDKINAGSL